MGGFTAVPNCILDALDEMTEKEVKVTMYMLRQTLGNQVEFARFTVRDTAKALNMSPSTVSNAMQIIKVRGFFQKLPRSEWVINVPNIVTNSNNEKENVTKFSTKQDNSNDDLLRNSVQNVTKFSTKTPIYKDINNIKDKKDNKNIYISFPNIPKPIDDLITALTAVSKTRYYEKTQDNFVESAYELAGQDVTPEQVLAVGELWKTHCWYDIPSPMALKTAVETVVQYKRGQWPQIKKANGTAADALAQYESMRSEILS